MIPNSFEHSIENNNVLFHRAVINLQNYELSGSTLQAQITEKVIILECKILDSTVTNVILPDLNIFRNLNNVLLRILD